MVEPLAPRCPGCGESLAEHARYRSVPVSPDDGPRGPTLPLLLVYCGRCGTAIAGFGSALPGSLSTGLANPPAETAGRPARLASAPRRPLPLRHFPGAVETVGLSGLPADTRVELRYEDGRALEGTIGPVQIDLHVVVQGFRASARGKVGEESLTVAWDFTSRSPEIPNSPDSPEAPERPDIAVVVEGFYAEQPVDLRATFHFEPAAWFHHGDVIGNLAGAPLRAHVEPADGGFDSPATVAVDGVLGAGTFSVFASVAGDHRHGAVRGSVEGRPLLLDAQRVTDASGSSLRLTGAFEGSPAVLLLAIGTLLHFQ